MGSCSSVHKATRLFVPSPRKEKPLNGDNPVKMVGSGLSLKSPEFGSKEEMFFDSRAWLDSDCEDDFFSVNGEFTPSRGSTPNNQTSTLSTPKSNKPFSFDKFLDSKPEPSPTGRKKLADLFQETSQLNASDEKVETNRNPEFLYQTKTDQPPNGAKPVNSSEPSPSRDFKYRKEKAEGKATQCCLPSLVQSFSFDERRQKMNPVNCSA